MNSKGCPKKGCESLRNMQSCQFGGRKEISMSERESEILELLQCLSVEQLQAAAALVRLMLGVNDSADGAAGTADIAEMAVES